MAQLPPEFYYVVQALDAIYAPETPPLQRQQAQSVSSVFSQVSPLITLMQTCESLKQHPDTRFLFSLSAYLVSENHTAHVRHFGLLLLEHVVRTRWESLGQQERSELNAACINMMSQACYSCFTIFAYFV